jgi:hypothetical protein
MELAATELVWPTPDASCPPPPPWWWWAEATSSALVSWSNACSSVELVPPLRVAAAADAVAPTAPSGPAALLAVDAPPFSAVLSWASAEDSPLAAWVTAALAVDWAAAMAAERGSCSDVRKANAELANWLEGLAEARVGAMDWVVETLPLGKLCPVEPVPVDWPAALDCSVAISICKA